MSVRSSPSLGSAAASRTVKQHPAHPVLPRTLCHLRVGHVLERNNDPVSCDDLHAAEAAKMARRIDQFRLSPNQRSSAKPSAHLVVPVHTLAIGSNDSKVVHAGIRDHHCHFVGDCWELSRLLLEDVTGGQVDLDGLVVRGRQMVDHACPSVTAQTGVAAARFRESAGTDSRQQGLTIMCCEV